MLNESLTINNADYIIYYAKPQEMFIYALFLHLEHISIIRQKNSQNRKKLLDFAPHIM
jgi:hypothetical protein